MNGELWHHQPGDAYVVVAPALVGDPVVGYGLVYYVDPVLNPSRAAGWRRGLTLTLRPCSEPSDDFNLAVVRGAKVVATLWEDRVVDDDPAELEDLARAVGLAIEGLVHGP